MKVGSKAIKPKVAVASFTLMATSTKVSGPTIWLKVLASIRMQMELVMTECGLMISNMVRARKGGLMVRYMSVAM